jgi:DNA polymerase-3 subunit chi
MTDIRFYHLQKQTLDQALPLILEKAFEANHRVLVKMANAAEVDRMNTHLWTYRPDKFLPHGSQKNGHAKRQPIWLTDKENNDNNADILVLTQGQTDDNIETYGLVCEILDGQDDQTITSARARWKAYSEAGHDVTYWYQSESGKWEKKT